MLGRIREALADAGVRTLGRRGGTLLAGQLAAGLLAVAIAVLLARGLGADDYGRYALISTSVALVLQAIDVRIGDATARYAAAHLARGDAPRARAVIELGLPVNTLGGLLAAAVIVAAAGPLADAIVKDPGLTDAVRVYAFVAPPIAFRGACNAALRVLDRFAMLGSLPAAVSAARLVAVAVALALGSGVEGVIVALLVAEIAVSVLWGVVTWVVVVRSVRTPVGFASRVEAIRPELPEIGRFMLHANPSGTLNLLSGQLDVLLAGAIATPTVAGALRLARTFTEPLAILWRPFTQAVYPTLSHRAARGELARIAELLRASTTAILLVLAPGAVAIAALAPVLVPALVGSGFDQTPATIAPLALAALVNGALFWTRPAALALGMQALALRAVAIAIAFQVALLLALVPVLEAPGAGLAFLAYTLISNAIVARAIARRPRSAAADG